jgi:hypothetical protein
MSEPSPFDHWLSGKGELHPFVEVTPKALDLDKGVLVAIETRVPIHESYRIGESVFRRSWAAAHSYLANVERILGCVPKLLTQDQLAQMTKNNLGRPPQWSYPLYLIAISKPGAVDPYVMERSKQLEAEYGAIAKIVIPDDHRLVYVGKKASGDRFRDGHKAITKLHHPTYREYDKWVFEARVTVKTQAGATLPLEWVRDRSAAERLLYNIESQLIYFLQPELNEDGKETLLSKWTTNFGFANWIPGSTFLKGTFLLTGVEDIPEEFTKVGVISL